MSAVLKMGQIYEAKSSEISYLQYIKSSSYLSQIFTVTHPCMLFQVNTVFADFSVFLHMYNLSHRTYLQNLLLNSLWCKF